MVRRRKWQPAKGACLKRVEDVRKFQCMEGPEGRFPHSRNGALKPVHECAPPNAIDQSRFCSHGTCPENVVSRLIQRRGAMKENPAHVGGNCNVGPAAIRSEEHTSEL